MTVEYECTSCGATFGSAGELIEHARKVHSVEVE